MSAFDCFDAQVNATIVFADRGVAGISEWTRSAIAKARDRIFVSTKVCLVALGFSDGGFEGAKLVIHHLPNHFVILHVAGNVVCSTLFVVVVVVVVVVAYCSICFGRYGQ